MKKIRVKATFIEDVLGTASSDPDIHENFIASNAPDAKTRKEEIEAVGVEEVVEKSKTIFPKDTDGTPIFWDYQIKGFFKDACSALQRYRAVEIDENGKKKKGAPEKCARHSCNLTSFKKVIDGCYMCGSHANLELHHIFAGANRNLSTQDGLMVYLCHACHNEPPNGVHHNIQNMRKLQRMGQRTFEENWIEKHCDGVTNEETEEQARIAFMLRYGRNYIWEDKDEED